LRHIEVHLDLERDRVRSLPKLRTHRCVAHFPSSSWCSGCTFVCLYMGRGQISKKTSTAFPCPEKQNGKGSRKNFLSSPVLIHRTSNEHAKNKKFFDNGHILPASLSLSLSLPSCFSFSTSLTVMHPLCRPTSFSPTCSHYPPTNGPAAGPSVGRLS